MKPPVHASDHRRLALRAGLTALLLTAALPAGAEDDPWSSLSDSQRTLLAPFRDQWNGWPAQERSIWIHLADQMPSLSDAQREHALERIREWAALSPAERDVARRNFRLAKSLNRDDRVRKWERYNSMTPEQRSVLRAFPLLGGESASSPLPGQPAHPLGLAPTRR
ncbi:MAG: DUF3106 domain-containing protein [Burkholderiaceae bacterium]